MKEYILKRFLQLIPVVILVSVFSFLIIQAAPGDPIQNYIKPGMTEDEIQAIRVEYGVDGTVAEITFHIDTNGIGAITVIACLYTAWIMGWFEKEQIS